MEEKRFIAVQDERTHVCALIRLLDAVEIGMLFTECLALQPTFKDQKSNEAAVNRIIVSIAGEIIFRRAMHGELPMDETTQKLVEEVRNSIN